MNIIITDVAVACADFLSDADFNFTYDYMA